MTDTIIVRESGGARIGSFEFTRRGLVVHGQPPFEEWADVYKTLETMSGAIQLWMGDLLNYAEQEADYGEKYSQFLDQLAYGTQATWAWVARKVEFSTRSENLSFEHHRKVAPLPPPEQDRLLREAEREGWSAAKLGRVIRAEKGDPLSRTLYEGEGLLCLSKDCCWSVHLPANVDMDAKPGDTVAVTIKSIGGVG